MNILFLIGNGFDINIGMKTKYRDFYDYYLKYFSSDSTIVKFKDEIKNNIENWSDLELKLGEYLEQLQEYEALSVYNDVTNGLQKYIQEEEGKYSYNIDPNIIRKDLIYPEKYLRSTDSQYIKNILRKENEHCQVRIISFNYTKSLENLIEFKGNRIVVETARGVHKSIEEMEHIHGYANERMILGVNDATQIKNQELRGNKKIVRRFIKSSCNRTYGLRHEEKCLAWINASHLICLYGLSLGDTDKMWWTRIAKRLVNRSCFLIIFYYDRDFQENAGPDYEDKADEVRDLFLSKVQLSNGEKQDITTKIYICFSRDIFNVHLSRLSQ